MSELPPGIDSFLRSAGWGAADIDPIQGDASFRRYFRIKDVSGDRARKAMLMFAPPPEEDPKPFLHVARWLSDNEQRAPEIYAEDAAQGWVLIEDFGNDRMRDWLDANPSGETKAYEAAIDALVELHQQPAGPFGPYDMAAYQRETALLTEWYCPAMGLDVDEAGYTTAWNEALAPMLDRQKPGVTVLRDYHAENIMLLGPSKDGSGAQGLIDFQDALVGHPAYDLVSLLQDARRDVSPELERTMLDHYLANMRPDAEFEADYARLGAQRNAKIVGIFTRLNKRDGKPHYLDLIPRVWEAMERDLAHPALAPVAAWFDANIPNELRDAKGGLP
ncbi:phosphotransferase [Pontixanthobacter aestiaquae]|uniref:Phosphotransferase n=1 Tax=Pontixanthobacter aestiaquae TaxID=1509367 RepID=A0A844Z647_9SPHN|nr:phosphotransferase [Pontixanthobacter aestiaquae]MDN3645608.1 phosphotransferase [Pontixanthobacter aestiaquae]MXO83395.1 phosphotransferase [Pontixanthobacter aestiaquae]